jgi:hypothetical protein
MLKRIAEQRGIAGTLGKEIPTLGSTLKGLPSGEVGKAIALSTGLGAGGGIAGHFVGKGKKKKTSWPEALMGLAPVAAQMAVPYMQARGRPPQLISAVQDLSQGRMPQFQGLEPASPIPPQGALPEDAYFNQQQQGMMI